MNVVLRKMHNYFLEKKRAYTNNMMLKAIEKEKGMQAWQGFQMMYIGKKASPIEAFEDIFMQMNEHNLHSDQVTQDVLILTGRNDHFIPFRAHRMQVEALTHAHSVTAKVFTKETQAHNHCQIGNIGLALDVMVEWIAAKSAR
jgi:hypothetical protein